MARLSEIQRLSHHFFCHLEEERGCSEKTIENYARYVARFLRWSAVKHPEEITDDIVCAYRSWLDTQGPNRPLAQKTKNYHFLALRAFLRFLHTQGVSTLEPKRVTLAKEETRAPVHLTKNERTRLLDAIDGDDSRAIRDKALLQLLFATGLRVSELCALDIDVELSSDRITIPHREKESRIVSLSKEARQSVCAWRAMRTDSESALFTTLGKHTRADGTNRLTPRSVQRILKHYATKAGIVHTVTPQTVRHTCAAALLEHGAGLSALQEQLGYENERTARAYVRTTHAAEQGSTD